jgi:hypothetical protein
MKSYILLFLAFVFFVAAVAQSSISPAERDFLLALLSLFGAFILMMVEG